MVLPLCNFENSLRNIHHRYRGCRLMTVQNRARSHIKTKRDAFYDFINEKLTGEILDDLNYHLAGLLDTIDALYSRYNELLNENGFGHKYDLGNVQMFIIEGMDKVREVIEKKRKRKNRTVIHKPLKYTPAQTAAVVNIKPDVSINIILKKMQIKISS